jgi:hypothetical protein
MGKFRKQFINWDKSLHNSHQRASSVWTTALFPASVQDTAASYSDNALVPIKAREKGAEGKPIAKLRASPVVTKRRSIVAPPATDPAVGLGTPCRAPFIEFPPCETKGKTEVLHCARSWDWPAAGLADGTTGQ